MGMGEVMGAFDGLYKQRRSAHRHPRDEESAPAPLTLIVGDGVTVYPSRSYTVVSVHGRNAVIQEDSVTAGPFVGMTAVQRLSIKPNPGGATKAIAQRDDGQWYPTDEGPDAICVIAGRVYQKFASRERCGIPPDTYKENA